MFHEVTCTKSNKTSLLFPRRRLRLNFSFPLFLFKLLSGSLWQGSTVKVSRVLAALSLYWVSGCLHVFQSVKQIFQGFSDLL